LYANVDDANIRIIAYNGCTYSRSWVVSRDFNISFLWPKK